MRTWARAGSAGMLGLLLALSACHRRSENAADGLRHYDGRGLIRAIAPDRRTIDVEHEAIPGFMPSMTMPFSVRDAKEITGLHLGNAISFRLTVTDRDSWIDRIRKVDVDEVHLASPPPSRNSIEPTRLREGDAMPPFELTNQDGRTINLESFGGHPFVLTFIFTRCPIPNFCPLMSRNFLALQRAIKSGNGPTRDARLLSISFDPDFDTPEILKVYASQEQADPAVWTFATGEKTRVIDLTHLFSVYVQAESGTISHGLATALVDGNGIIQKIWRGNGWSIEEVLRALDSATR